MKRTDTMSSNDSEQAIKQVLQAERDAEQAVRDCEDEAHEIIRQAHIRAKEIHSRIDQRITNMEMRHGHKLDQTIKSMEKEGEVELQHDISHNYADKDLRVVIEKMAAELCRDIPPASDTEGDS